MALSDNVLNVGFTSRSEIDEHLPIVQESITFQSVDPSTIALSRTPFVKGLKGNTTVYSVPFEEFSILHTAGEEEMEAFTGPAIGIVTSEGAVTVGAKGEEGVHYERGSVFFVPAHTGFRTEGNGEVWMAFYDGDDKTKDQVGAQ
jgi:mannose-6-phosphate isomerase